MNDREFQLYQHLQEFSLKRSAFWLFIIITLNFLFVAILVFFVRIVLTFNSSIWLICGSLFLTLLVFFFKRKLQKTTFIDSLILSFLICIEVGLLACFILLPIIKMRLGISDSLGIAFLILTGTGVNLEIYFLFFNIRFLDRINIPLYMVKTQDSKVHFLAINVSGGLLPLLLALYQFSRTPASSILIVTTIVAVICYFSVIVLPGTGIFFKSGSLLVTSIANVLSSICLAFGKSDGTDVSVAFAAGVMGTLIGADLLHLKDIQLKKAVASISIGGAGANDGILRCGFYSLLLAELIKKIAVFIEF
jgi:uncharacterized membrane protein